MTNQNFSPLALTLSGFVLLICFAVFLNLFIIELIFPFSAGVALAFLTSFFFVSALNSFNIFYPIFVCCVAALFYFFA